MLKLYIHLVVCSSLVFMGILSTSINEIVAKFHQSDYKIGFEWAEIVRYDKKDVAYLHGVAFKYNRTCTAANLTWEYNIDVGNDLELVIQMYKFASNEYRLFPLRFQVNFCYAMSKNMVGARGAYKCGNYTGCPVRKGQRRHICNFTPDESQFPPFIPNGRYMIEAQTMYYSKELLMIRYYGSVTRPLV